MTRTRTINFGNKGMTPYSQSKIVYRDARPELVYPPSYSAAITDSVGSATITDENKFPHRFNACNHSVSKSNWTGYLTPWTWVAYNASGNYDEYRRYFWSWKPSVGEKKDTVSGGGVPAYDAAAIWRDLLDQADTAQCGIQGMVSLAEVGQTVATVMRPWKMFKSLRSFVDAPKWTALRRMRTKDALDYAANSWLSWRYGWRPFISDMKAIVNAQSAIRKAIEREDDMHGKVEEFHVKSNTKPTIVRVPRDGLTTLEITSAEYSRNTVVRAVVAPPPGYPRAYRHIAAYLGLNQFVESAWEVIPFSFVIDWFVPAGNLLKELREDAMGLNDRKRIHIKEAWTTTISSVRQARVRRQTVGTTPFEVKLMENEVRTYTRYPIDLTAVSPTLWSSTTPWGLNRTIDGAALSLQRLKR